MFEKLRQKKWFPWAVVTILVLLTLTSRVCVAYFLANDDPGDGVVYARLARNLLEQGVYSTEAEAPFTPTLVRLPGYPLFLAGVYSIFGHENNTAVRIIQAVFDTATCVIIALLAFLWTEDQERKRRRAMWAFLLAALCPFIVIYTATILTETLTTFLMGAMTLTATLGFKASRKGKAFLWWSMTGLLAGIAVFVRPDNGLFAAGIGVTLVISGLFFTTGDSPKFSKRLVRVIGHGVLFSGIFVLVLTPWTVRNYRLFGVFQPISPAHADMPGEFVPLGYFRWLRTWVDDSRFIEPMQWNLGEKPINISVIPPKNFDSPEEHDRVAALLEQYNHPPGSKPQKPPDEETSDETSDEADSGDNSPDDTADDTANANDTSEADSADADKGDSPDDESDADDENKKYIVKMTPEIDAEFGRIADERISRWPFRYYLFVPAKRAAALWFDSHSLYYPFGGQMSPVRDLDYDEHQQYWLPGFTLLMWIYTLLGVGGALVLWRARADTKMLRWLVLVALMTLPRVAFLSSVENPEQRYVIELFAFTALLGGIFRGNLRPKRSEPEEIPLAEPPSDRIVSLDVFRGMTIAAMTLVNMPGTWDAIYPPLEHAEWNGATPTDWIFPFFLFIAGASISLALGKRVDEQTVDRGVYFKIFKRAGLLFALGILLEIFPFYNIWTAAWFEPSTLRIMGVLQRIAICYMVAALIFLHTNWKRQAIIAAVILLGYWALVTVVNVPGCDTTSFNDKACNLSAYLDRVILTGDHIWSQSKVFDPEGLLSTLPAIATTLAGVLAGQWLRSGLDGMRKFAGMFVGGAALAIAGWVWSFWFPLNKSLWTSSYVVYTAGLACVFLAVCYWLVDLRGYKRWAKPFVIFGSNAIALYVGSTIVETVLSIVYVAAPHDQTMTFREKIFTSVFLPLGAPIDASLYYASSFVFIWLFLMWVLYRRKIFLKI